MLLDDVIYVGLLLLCIGFGQVYRGVESTSKRQWLGTALGLSLATLVSGPHIAHPLISTLVTALLVTRLSPKICHLASFFWAFFYLLFVFRLSEWFGLPTPPGHANLVQMMLTLKLAGLAFEINSAAATRPEDDPQGASSAALARIGLLDVFHYAFSYIGVLTGPYYRYRTYWDSLHRPFAAKADHWAQTRRKLLQISGFTLCFLLSNHLFPAKYALTDEFAKRSLLYRFWYIYPTFVTFRMRMYIGMVMSECVCQMAGLGAYPSCSEPVSGLGPKDYKSAIALSNEPRSLKPEELDFETVHNMNVWEVEKCILVRDAMKKWNTCVQYWMAVCVYKRFPHRGLRTAATLALSALWHGYAPGYYLCICQITFFLPMEDIYARFYKESAEASLKKTALHCLLWFTRISCMSYLGLSFQLLQLDETLTFYRSIYFAGHLLVLGLYVIGRLVRSFAL
ncbi:lysophospholipid acyltransferase 7 [Nasonia vitripennis]|uniref:Lysophospholipid acyltransferase 7 n=1 Tax=Nasonia vitripennis TaxID=7425 RepID=A0A7M7IV90_NASVI|nr:lysophospholipid acyltransferase 7 [Nasonia vitripennis]XP_016845240.1 lysophospholipid acyltransferase 7 [Nasonia vitripennis]XP_016845242.1 lysophospholipid acyltransferase 7 [Nasonia vitripennis]